MNVMKRLAAGAGLATLLMISGAALSATAAAETGVEDQNLAVDTQLLLDAELQLEVVPPGLEDWPENTNGELPLAGILYGNPYGGIGTSNTPIAYESSRRFRAERSGLVSAVKYQNRVLRNYEIHARCGLSGNDPDNDYCKCKNEGLDALSCGYTMDSYSVGNGGTIVVEMRPDNGNGLPSDEVLGKTEAFVPMDNERTWYPELNFVTPPELEAGRIYHLVYTNLNPPANCDLKHVPNSKARSCPRNQGAVSLNGNYLLSDPESTGRLGPFRGRKSAMNFYRRAPGADWEEFRNALSYYELRYTDGVAVGDSSLAEDAVKSADFQVSGNSRVRQNFKVLDVDRHVDGMWLNFGHNRGADGSPLRVELKNESGSVVYSGQMASSEYCLERVTDARTYAEYNCRDWGYLDFGKVITLSVGYSYSVELSAESQGRYTVSAYQPFTYHGFKNRNHWFQAYAQNSGNSGRSWDSWAGKWETERDLPLAFTISGMPKQLP